VLERFIPVSFWARVAQETNAYRERCLRDPAAVDGDDPDITLSNVEGNDNEDLLAAEAAMFNRDYDLKWKDQSLGSIVTWVGMHIGMCLRPRANQSSYWDPRHIGALRPDAYGDYMSRNRFNLINKYFYINHAKPQDFVDNKLINPLHKVQPLVDILVKTFGDNWTINKYNCVDEGKVPYKGTFCPVQSYDPDKPYKYGPKLHLANDSATGYCWGLSCYTGAGHNYPLEPEDWLDNFGFGERTVLHFARKMPWGSHLYTDRYYSSPNLAVKLRDEYHVYLTGTMIGNRKRHPVELVHVLEPDRFRQRVL
jgi:hypothetical protein